MYEKSAEVLNQFRKQYTTDNSIADLTPTVCRLCGVPEPDKCGGIPVAQVMDQADKLMDGVGKVEKVLLFCADALGEVQRQHFTEDFAAIEKAAGFRVPSVAVMPSVTPVCYGSIFSGAAPCVHGIEKYEKPVLQIETLFDVFAKSGKNVAICAVNGCSIDMIFRNRNIDYYSFRTDEQSFQCARELMAHKNYDLIVCYMTDYDAKSHKFGRFSPEASEQAHWAAERFQQFAADMDLYWKNYNRVLVFVPDHGNHQVDEIHAGHGSEQSDDMLVNHYYRICEKKSV